MIFTSSALLNVLKILIDSQIFFFQILSMPTIISEILHFFLWLSNFTIIWQLYGGYLYSLENWRVPWRTHNNMLPHLAGMIVSELWFVKRCIKFISMCMKSDNNTVKTISMMGVNGLYSVVGANIE